MIAWKAQRADRLLLALDTDHIDVGTLWERWPDLELALVDGGLKRLQSLLEALELAIAPLQIVDPLGTGVAWQPEALDALEEIFGGVSLEEFPGDFRSGLLKREFELELGAFIDT